MAAEKLAAGKGLAGGSWVVVGIGAGPENSSTRREVMETKEMKFGARVWGTDLQTAWEGRSVDGKGF